jgi:hypothetical protein
MPQTPTPPTPPLYDGPLHLQGALGSCSEPLLKAMLGSVGHPINTPRMLSCACRTSGVMRSVTADTTSSDPEKRARAERRVKQLEIHIKERRHSASGRLGNAAEMTERRQNCRLFAVELNEEAGVVRAYCKRCQRMFPVFDRVLYWGLQREGGTPESFPYRCTCGGHTFEVGVGFDYPRDAMDENDIHTITVAVRCAACEEISLLLDEEAT